MISTQPKQALIAIVDDDPSVCRALERLVRSLGFTGATFNNGEDFLQRVWSVPSFRPDCVVLDIHMPGITGIEVQRRLAGTGLPVVLITAHDDARLREEGLAAGAIALLRKPFNDQVFVDTLHAAVSAS